MAVACNERLLEDRTSPFRDEGATVRKRRKIVIGEAAFRALGRIHSGTLLAWPLVSVPLG
jgi:hypothetical protein